ncbi:MAG: polysaccharide biosynthesis tyrosine autokinase, partial [Candidatus Omnitrophota bacterium]
ESAVDVSWARLFTWGSQPQLALLRSRKLATRVVKRLNLRETPDQLLTMVTVKPRRGSNVCEVAARSKYPEKAANIANMWLKEFINLDIEREKAAVGEGAPDLKKRVFEESQKIFQFEKELNKFEKENKEAVEKGKRIKRLEARSERLKKDLKTLSGQYEEDHPRIAYFNTELKSMEEQVKKEKDAIFAANLQDKVAEYDLLVRKVGNQKVLYNKQLEKIRKISPPEKLSKANVQIVDEAQIPKKPLPWGRRAASLLLVGLLIGAAICFGLEYMDTTLKIAEEVEFYAKEPFLGYIPSIRQIVKSRTELYLFSHLKPDSKISESFRNIKVAMIFTVPEEKSLKTIAVTSSMSEEGKTFIASNLAISFARAKEETLLIDGDMRRGVLGKIYETKAKNGLSEVLDGKCSLKEAIVSTSAPGLSLLSSGGRVPNPTDLLSSEKFKDFMKEAGSIFQRVIIDVPSILSYADALFWGNNCEGLVHVIGASVTPLKDVTAAKEKLKEKAHIIGAVLNNVSIEKDFRYYYHYYQSFLEKKFAKK